VDVAVIVPDHPEVKPFQEENVIADGVLFERPSPLTGCGFDHMDRPAAVGASVAAVGPDEAPPVHTGAGDPLRPVGADPVGAPQFGDGLTDERGIAFVQPVLVDGTPDR